MKNNELLTYSKDLFIGVSSLINEAKSKVAVYVNVETTVLYWSIGDFISKELKHKQLLEYGKQILATVSQELTEQHGKGFSYSALTRMIKIAETFPKEIIATLSQHLSWSHFIQYSVKN